MMAQMEKKKIVMISKQHKTNNSLHTLEQKGTLTTSNKIENLEVFNIGICEEEI
jgi:hypothetical protein